MTYAELKINTQIKFFGVSSNVSDSDTFSFTNSGASSNVSDSDTFFTMYS